MAKRSPRGLDSRRDASAGRFDLAGGVRADVRNAYVPGITDSTDFPVTPDALQPTYRGGPSDAFVLKLNEQGSRLRFSTFLGGSGEDGSAGAGEWLDRSGNFYVPGFTNSADFPATRRAFQNANAGGFDIFLVKMAFDQCTDSDKQDRQALAEGGRRAPLRTHGPPTASGTRTGMSPIRGLQPADARLLIVPLAGALGSASPKPRRSERGSEGRRKPDVRTTVKGAAKLRRTPSVAFPRGVPLPSRAKGGSE